MQVDRRKRCFSAQRVIRKFQDGAPRAHDDDAVAHLIRFAYDPVRIPKCLSAGSSDTEREASRGRILLRSKKTCAQKEPETRGTAQIIRFPARPRR
jgi:hypothetical protein